MQTRYNMLQIAYMGIFIISIHNSSLDVWYTNLDPLHLTNKSLASLSTILINATSSMYLYIPTICSSKISSNTNLFG